MIKFLKPKESKIREDCEFEVLYCVGGVVFGLSDRRIRTTASTTAPVHRVLDVGELFEKTDRGRELIDKELRITMRMLRNQIVEDHDGKEAESREPPQRSV